MADVPEVYDLLILVDATYSMSDYLESLQTSLPKIISISALTDSFSRIGLLAYRDYCDSDLLEWSGWMYPEALNEGKEQPDLLAVARTLEPIGGGDYPEATKTGLAKAYEVMREEATTIVLLYTDAPPHTTINGYNNGYDNHEKEQKALAEVGSYGGFGPEFTDWVHAGRMMAMKESGKKRAQVFSILAPNMQRSDGNYYTFLSTLTGGACFYLNTDRPGNIAKVTVDLLLAWMGAEKAGAAVVEIAAKLAKFKSSAGIENVKKEATKKSTHETHTEELVMSSAVLREFIPKRKTQVKDFAQRYTSDPAYKRLVVEHLKKIIEQDVSSISLNPVFGSLWRAVCNDRTNEKREELIASFGLQVDRIRDADEKQRMKLWLEESYDYGMEIQDAINAVPEASRFPCVYLDPTLAFTRPSDAEEDEGNRAIVDFRRDELLEIGRSCDYRILRRLGRVLTQLTFVNKLEELPEHIAKAENGEVTLVPMALASEEYNRKFWGVLLHIIVPGTMLSARPAALLAALSIRLGVQPLFEAAAKEMMLWRGRWNNLEVPENWNISCLSLILDADEAYLARKNGEESQAVKTKGLLLQTDRKLFERLVAYMMLEMNLGTTIQASVGWTPDKTTMAVGPVVQCRSCLYPRSVTVMGLKNKCGNCLATDYADDKERQARINSHVTKEDTETSSATWVECSTRTCRAQYVVYNKEALNVRPKCYYCRRQTSLPEAKRSNDPAPRLECEKCHNRVIFPYEYRTGDMTHYNCISCSTGRKSVVDVDTTARILSAENTTTWLLQNTGNKIEAPLTRQSLYKLITRAGTENFCEKVELFPSNGQRKLSTLNGKLIHNAPSLVEQLQSWVYGRKTEKGTCSLCFSDFGKDQLNPACGRRGCDQRICLSCLRSWYGLNAAGRILNIAACHCPFCRRPPTAKTLSSYGMGIHAVANLKNAVEENGTWIYAWCADCSFAKQYLERVCAAGAPAALTEFVCSLCQQLRDERAAVEAQELADQILALEVQARRENWEHRVATQEAIELARKKKAGIKVKELDLRRCPKCGAQTEKSGGCGHMTCVCGCHWCWFCCEKQQHNRIYDHMEQKHGGWFLGDEVGAAEYADDLDD
ncbi:hypothetical protein B0J14DRAFT_93250 [Halenospora varia]|nr:hypothetical protein B0J14DRAFT_93250 [Halenospora varia]